MNSFSQFVKRLAFLFGRKRFAGDLDDEMNQGQDLTGHGSSVGIDGLGSNISTASDQDRRKVMRKQKLNRENEIKWIHAATRLNADNVRRSTKVRISVLSRITNLGCF